jgi:hypothetical protein
MKQVLKTDLNIFKISLFQQGSIFMKDELGGLYHHTAHTIRGAGIVSGSPLIKSSERKVK